MTEVMLSQAVRTTQSNSKGFSVRGCEYLRHPHGPGAAANVQRSAEVHLDAQLTGEFQQELPELPGPSEIIER
jgi:hypothetical protein